MLMKVATKTLLKIAYLELTNELSNPGTSFTNMV